MSVDYPTFFCFKHLVFCLKSSCPSSFSTSVFRAATIDDYYYSAHGSFSNHLIRYFQFCDRSYFESFSDRYMAYAKAIGI